MAIEAADWELTRSSGNIRYIGADHGATGASYATVIQLHRWLQDLSDDPFSSGDDQLDITDVLPSSRATDNLITLLGSYNIDDGAAEHLYDGTIIQGTGGTEVYYDGIVNFGNVGVVIQIHQNGGVLADDYWNYAVGGADDTSTGAAFLTDSGETWTTDQWVGYVIKNTTDGSHALITSNTGTTILGTLVGGTNNDWDSGDNYLISQGINAASASGISHRFLVKTRSAGANIDNLKLLGTNRTYERTYGEFLINQAARGNNVLAISDASDLNNTTAEGTIAAYADVYMDRTDSTTTVNGVNAAGQNVLNVTSGAVFTAGDLIMTGVASDASEYQIASIVTNALTLNRNLSVATAGGETVYDSNYGYIGLDVNNDTTDEYYYTQWDKGAKTINQFYERMKWLSRDGSTEYVCGLEAELFRGITHELDVDTPTGTFADCEDISWTGGTGQLLAIDSPTAGTKIWFQLLTGVTPPDNDTITGGITGATVASDLTTGSLTDRSSLVATPYVGVSTGSSLIGAYGLSLQTNDLSASDLVFDLTNTAITPPNNVTFSVNGPEAAEDYIHVGPWDGTATDANGDPEIDYNQLTLSTALTTDNITAVVCTASIPTDTPSAGWVRVYDDLGFARRLKYSSFVTATFTIDAAWHTANDSQNDFAGTNATGTNVYIAYIDDISASDPEDFTFVFNAERKFVIKVRDGGGTPIKEYITSGTMGTNGGSTSVIRTTDE